MFNLAHLEVLLLSTNRLTHLSPSVSRLTRLQRLDLTANAGINRLPTSIAQLRAMKDLEVDPEHMVYPSVICLVCMYILRISVSLLLAFDYLRS